MNSLREKLQGKKTFFAVAIGLLYLIGVWAGFWEFDEKVLAAVGLGGIAFLRMALPSAGGATNGKTLPAIGLLPFAITALALSGCGTLDKSGVYAGDQVLYQADVAITTSYDLLHTFVKWEYENRQSLAAWPEVKQAADKIRANAKPWIGSAIALREAYAAAPTPENGAALQTALSVLRSALTEATKYLNAHDPPSPPVPH